MCSTVPNFHVRFLFVVYFLRFRDYYITNHVLIHCLSHIFTAVIFRLQDYILHPLSECYLLYMIYYYIIIYTQYNVTIQWFN